MRSRLHLAPPSNCSVKSFQRLHGACRSAGGNRLTHTREIAFFPPHGASRDADRKASGGASSPTPMPMLSAARRPARSAQLVRAGVAFLVAGIFAVFCTPQPVQAAQVIAIIRGTVTNGGDIAGTFGLGKVVSLVGFPYTLVYTMDDSDSIGKPIYGSSCAANGRQNVGLSSPITTAVLTINGRSFTFGNSPLSSITSQVAALDNGSSWLNFVFQPTPASYSPAVEGVLAGIDLSSITICRNWESPFSYTLQPSDLSSSSVAAAADLGPPPTHAVSVNFNLTLSVRTVTVSGPITPHPTPHIYFFDADKNQTFDVTNSAVPVPVVVGQPIILFAVPSAEPWTPLAWQIEGPTVGGFNHDGKCANPLKPPSPPCGGPVPPDFAPSATRFYWISAGPSGSATYNVIYAYTTGGLKQSLSVRSAFHVVGPFNQHVVPTPGIPGILLYPDTSVRAALGGKGFGIQFAGSASVPSKTAGQFLWVQLINKGEQAWFAPTSAAGCALPPGLDTAYPYSSPLPYATDNPKQLLFQPGNQPVTHDYYVNSSTGATMWIPSATMYFMWMPQVADPIPVPLGSVTWGFRMSAIGALHDWSIYEPGGYITPGQFMTSTQYPVWNAVDPGAKVCDDAHP